MRRILKTLFTLLLCAVLIVAGAIFGPKLLARFYGGANASWISERFSEELSLKRELVVLEKTITGQESVSTDAWLIGTVQTVVIPYRFSASFSVDLSLANVRYDEANGVIQVFLPAPAVEYYKLTVDEESVQTSDLLYPLTSSRYTEIKQEIEKKLYDEVVGDPELTESAWASAVSETEALYRSVLSANDAAALITIQVLEATPETAQ